MTIAIGDVVQASDVIAINTLATSAAIAAAAASANAATALSIASTAQAVAETAAAAAVVLSVPALGLPGRSVRATWWRSGKTAARSR